LIHFSTFFYYCLFANLRKKAPVYIILTAFIISIKIINQIKVKKKKKKRKRKEKKKEKIEKN
jgi:hypothetical protein